MKMRLPCTHSPVEERSVDSYGTIGRSEKCRQDARTSPWGGVRAHPYPPWQVDDPTSNQARFAGCDPLTKPRKTAKGR
jgi:hypothetical protein